MRSYIRERIVKSTNVEVLLPRVVDFPPDHFTRLTESITLLRQGLSAEEKTEIAASLDESSWNNGIGDPVSLPSLTKEEGENLAQIIIAQAEKDAEDLRLAAREEGERLKAEIRRQAEEELFPQAEARGYREGLMQGTAEGETLKKQGAKVKEEAQALWQLAQRAVQEEYAKTDEELLHLALSMAERIIRTEIDVNPQRLLERIRALTILPQERNGWVLHLSPEDEEWIAQLPQTEQPNCPWVSDETLARGDCYLECTEGLFDARVKAQLEKLEQVLLEELRHGRLEHAGSKN